MVPDVVPLWFLQAGRSLWVWRWSEGWKEGTVAREQPSLYLWAVVTMGTRRNKTGMSSILADQIPKPSQQNQKKKSKKQHRKESKKLMSVSLHYMHRISWRLSWGNPDYELDLISFPDGSCELNEPHQRSRERCPHFPHWKRELFGWQTAPHPVNNRIKARLSCSQHSEL